MTVHVTFKYDVPKLKYQHLGFVLVFTFQLWDIAFESDALMHHVLNAAAQNYLLFHANNPLHCPTKSVQALKE